MIVLNSHTFQKANILALQVLQLVEIQGGNLSGMHYVARKLLRDKCELPQLCLTQTRRAAGALVLALVFRVTLSSSSWAVTLHISTWLITFTLGSPPARCHHGLISAFSGASFSTLNTPLHGGEN